jgi:hypothetical protein
MTLMQNRCDAVSLPTVRGHKTSIRYSAAFPRLHFYATLFAPRHLVICITCILSAWKEPKRPQIPHVLDVLSHSHYAHILVVADSFDRRFWVTVLPSILLNQVLPVFMANRGTSENELLSVVIQRIFASCTQEYLYGVSRLCVI